MLNTLTVAADGVAYGMLLFLFSIGLSITLGLMRLINLAHGAFGMCGGYVVTTSEFGELICQSVAEIADMRHAYHAV